MAFRANHYSREGMPAFLQRFLRGGEMKIPQMPMQEPQGPGARKRKETHEAPFGNKPLPVKTIKRVKKTKYEDAPTAADAEKLPHGKGEIAEKHIRKNKFAFETPMRACVVGESGSGKTEWVVKYLQQCPFDQVIWCGPEHSIEQDGLKPLKEFYGQYFSTVDCTDGINHEELKDLIDNGHRQKWQTAVVFDDCIMYTKDKKIGTLFVSGRHQGVSVFELTQQIFPPGSRLHRINCTQFVVFKFSAVDEFATLVRQITRDQEMRREVIKRYHELTRNKKDYRCMIIDKASHSTEKWPCRIRDTEINCFMPEFWDF